VQGAALGGGTALAACADVVVAASNAQFGCTEVRVGVIPAVVAPYLRRRLSPAAARRLLLTGEVIRAPRALELGLVDIVVDETELDATVDSVVSQFLSGNHHAQRAVKPLLDTLLSGDTEGVTQLAVEASARFRTSPESKKALAAFLATLRSGQA
jgi:methylglutaconyl-CoA hydratase